MNELIKTRYEGGIKLYTEVFMATFNTVYPYRAGNAVQLAAKKAKEAVEAYEKDFTIWYGTSPSSSSTAGGSPSS